MPTRKEIEAWVAEALKEPDKQYQLIEVCRTVAELERNRIIAIIAFQCGPKTRKKLLDRIRKQD